jgi:ferric-dicitrate binding protein FerR (iron transport regulator)
MQPDDIDRRLDEVLDAMRADEPDKRLADRAGTRAWANIRAQVDRTERAWSAASNRTSNRPFEVAPTGADKPRVPSRAAQLLASRSARVGLAAAAAVALAVGVATVAPRLTIPGQVGAVHAAEGFVRLDGGVTHALAAGEAVASGSGVRTSDDGRAVLQLADGTRIELDERSELRLDRTLAGPAVQVIRGRVLVTGGDGSVKILTPDVTVGAGASPAGGDGRTYLVNRGVLGTRVTVLEGDVRVDGAGGDVPLAAGEQFTSSDHLQSAPVAQELAWSRDAGLYAELVAEFEAAHQPVRDALAAAPVRTDAGLAARVPDTTVIYAAFPNVVSELVTAQAQLFERLEADPRFASRFAPAPVGPSAGPAIDSPQRETEFPDGVAAALTSLADATGHLGEEIVVAWVMSEDDPVPVILASVADETAVQAALASLALEDLSVSVAGGLFVASPSSELTALVSSGGATGLEPAFRQAVSEAYARGVTWLGAVDLGAIGDRQAREASNEEQGVLESSGLLDTRFLVIEHRDDETRAHMSFDGPRHGMAAWLAAPAPVGALDFISGDATLAGAFASQDGVAMFDDVIAMFFGLGGTEAANDLVEFEAETGVDLRDDVASAVGGEVAFALDGAVLPEPSWKIVLEVLDPVRLQDAMDALVAHSAREGEDVAIVAHDGMAGSPLYTIRTDGEDLVVYTYSDGYLIAAPRRELVERALRYRADGFTLERSSAFRSLLPTDSRPHFSGIWYQNLGPVLEPLSRAGEIAGSELPSGAVAIMAQSLAPSVSVAYADDTGISVASRGGMGPFGLDLVGMLSSTQALGMAEAGSR